MSDVVRSTDLRPPKSGSETRSSVAMFLRVPAAEHTALAARALEDNITVQELVRRAATLAVDGKLDQPPQRTRASFSESDRVLFASVKRSMDSVAGLLIQAARDERRYLGRTELWASIERHLLTLNEARQILDRLVKVRR